ncbi:MAG TPA: peptidylprolyl isomerase [Flavisolibacter sp.]
MKKLIAVLLVPVFFFNASAQTLFQYGKETVSVQDFLKAYQKNNAANRSEAALREYLDLYIASRLKIAEANAMGLDTLPQLRQDLQSLRLQIIPAYMNDKDAVNRMVAEAFQRAQKDIHVAHIFIPVKAGDDAAAKQQAEEALAALNSGKSFTEVAVKYSADPSVTTNGGDIGWITVFVLPYELENLAYSTPAGHTSVLHRSKSGYHIFRNLGERKALGRIRAAEILLAWPADATPEYKSMVKKRADSIYNRLQKGDSFGIIASTFSNDVVSSAANGMMPEFGVGQYDRAFENVVLALKDGATSKPFQTSHGYHIVKRIGRTPVPAVMDDKFAAELKRRVEESDRLEFAKEAFIKKLMKDIVISEPAFGEAMLWQYSDSVLNNQVPRTPTGIQPTSSLLRIGDKNITAMDWISYARSFRYRTDGSGMKSYPVLWAEFVRAMVMNYYQEHLEEYNEDFRNQLKEFREGNLFFEIMQQKIWGPAQSDSVALREFYNVNRSRYNWDASADAVIFYAADAESAEKFSALLKKSPTSWQALIADMSDKIAADSNRFEVSQLPGYIPTMKAGAITAPVVNNTDRSASFAMIIRTYPAGQPRSFFEARGLVINDYQAELEKKWLAELKKKYPVQLNEDAWNQLIRSKRW